MAAFNNDECPECGPSTFTVEKPSYSPYIDVLCNQCTSIYRVYGFYKDIWYVEELGKLDD